MENLEWLYYVGLAVGVVVISILLFLAYSLMRLSGQMSEDEYAKQFYRIMDNFENGE